MCHPILSVIILSNFVNHSHDYRPNWTSLSPITIINLEAGNPFGTLAKGWGIRIDSLADGSLPTDFLAGYRVKKKKNQRAEEAEHGELEEPTHILILLSPNI